jgi:UDP-N-acetylglucosamine 2-epimerase
MASPVFPYGDGHAAQKIVEALRLQLAPGTAVQAARRCGDKVA